LHLQEKLASGGYVSHIQVFYPEPWGNSTGNLGEKDRVFVKRAKNRPEKGGAGLKS
jgi:hypothetical protein